MKGKKWVSIIVVAAMILTLTACGQQSKERASVFPGTPEADTVVLDIVAEPADLNHFLVSDTVSDSVLRQCMSGLARLDKEDNPVPDIAEKWESNEEQTVYTITLRKDSQWSNGDPVTAHDFYFSWITQMKPQTGSMNASFLYSMIKNGEAFYNGEVEESQVGIEVVDDYTLKVSWEKAMPQGGFWLASPIFFPMNQKAYEAVEDGQYAKEPDDMVTNGAYRIAKWVHDDHILLEKSQEYWDGDRIQIPKVKLVMIGDDNARLNAFKAGEVDLCSLYSEQIDQVKQSSESAVHSYIDGGTWYLDFNMKNTYLSNVNLRKALAYSVDVQSLLDNVIKDGSVAAGGLVPTAIAGAGDKSYADERGSLFAYDPDAAKEYFAMALDELGLSASDIKLQLLVNDSSYGQTQAAYYQQQWKEKLDFDVELRVLTWKARVDAQLAGDYDVLVGSWAPKENNAMTFLENYVTGEANNLAGFSNEEYDTLIKEALQELDQKKRQELMIKAEEILIEEMVIGPLYYTSTAYAVSEKLADVVRTPFQSFNISDGAHITTEK